MNNIKNRHVIIVGGGLVGPLCALFMAKRGYKVSLYEYREDPRSLEFVRGRSINLALSNRARRALQELGLEEEILKCGIPMKGRYIHEVDGKNKSILYDPRTEQCIYSVSRNYLNQKLLDAIDTYSNVKMYFNHKLINVSGSKSCLLFLQTKTDTKIEVQGDLIIAADGAFSAVRKVMQQMPLFNFNQTYIDHGYIEMNITPKLGKTMAPNHLHIWPRGEFMMIALPNLDGSWTVTLFMPFNRFEELNTAEKILDFFQRIFPDSVNLIGKEQIVKDFLNTKPSALVSIKCSSFHNESNMLLLGDAAHAMVPFYGQGMNAGFEDCTILNSILDDCNDDFTEALKRFTDTRRDDAHAICDLAMYNYLEMRDLVRRPSYLLRKAFDDFLFLLFPNMWIPLYNSVTFSKMNYKQCIENREWQNNIIRRSLYGALIVFFLILAVTFYSSN